MTLKSILALFLIGSVLTAPVLGAGKCCPPVKAQKIRAAEALPQCCQTALKAVQKGKACAHCLEKKCCQAAAAKLPKNSKVKPCSVCAKKAEKNL